MISPMEDWYGLFFGALTGAACFGLRGALLGGLIGFLVGRSRARSGRPEPRATTPADGDRHPRRDKELSDSADRARADELFRVTRYLMVSGVPALQDAARELSELKHR